jgi:hypothetical protein
MYTCKLCTLMCWVLIESGVSWSLNDLGEMTNDVDSGSGNADVGDESEH